MKMFEAHPSKFKKYQHFAGIVGCIGFLLGMVISGVGILLQIWNCPFGNGLLGTLCFLLLIGLGSAVLFGNLVAVMLIVFAKLRQKSRK